MEEEPGGGHAPTLGAPNVAWLASSTGEGGQLLDDDAEDDDAEGVADLAASDLPASDVAVLDLPASDFEPPLSEDVPEVDDAESDLRESVR